MIVQDIGDEIALAGRGPLNPFYHIADTLLRALGINVYPTQQNRITLTLFGIGIVWAIYHALRHHK